MNFAVPADHRVTLKRSENKGKYINFARRLKKQWNMKMMVTPDVTGALGRIPKVLVKELEDLKIGGKMKTNHTTALSKLA